MKRNNWIVALLAVVLAAAPAAQVRAADSEAKIDYTIRVAQSPSLCQAPLQIAAELGFFEAEGLSFENIQVDPAHVSEALGADQVDVAQGMIAKLLQPIENGLGIKMVAGIHTGCVKLIAPKDSGVESVKDLVGKKVGVPGLADAATIVVERSLAAEGIRFKMDDNPEVEFVVFEKADLAQALQNGAIDVIAVNDPTASQLEKELDLVPVIDTATDMKYCDEYCCAVLVTDKLAEEHPDAAAAFTRALLKASAWVDAHPAEAAKITNEALYVSGDVDFNAEVLQTYDYKPSVQGGYDAVYQSVEELTQIGILKEGTDAKAFADGAYAFFEGVEDSYSIEEAEAAIAK